MKFGEILLEHISYLYEYIDKTKELAFANQANAVLRKLKEEERPKLHPIPFYPQIFIEDDVKVPAEQTSFEPQTDIVVNLFVEMCISLNYPNLEGNIQIPPPDNNKQYGVDDLEKILIDGGRTLSTCDNCLLYNIFVYGRWLKLWSEAFMQAKKDGILLFNGTWKDWIDQNCKVKKSQAYKYMKFAEQFKKFRGVLWCQLSFSWFSANGKVVSDYLQIHEKEEIGQFWQKEDRGEDMYEVTCDVMKRHFKEKWRYLPSRQGHDAIPEILNLGSVLHR